MGGRMQTLFAHLSNLHKWPPTFHTHATIKQEHTEITMKDLGKWHRKMYELFMHHARNSHLRGWPDSELYFLDKAEVHRSKMT